LAADLAAAFFTAFTGVLFFTTFFAIRLRF
jgi:hypothetical protein